MVRMLRHVGRILGRHDDVEARDIQLVAIQVALQNGFPVVFTDRNLDPLGLNLFAKGLHHPDVMPLGPVQTIGISDGGCDDGSFHSSSLNSKVGNSALWAEGLCVGE